MRWFGKLIGAILFSLASAASVGAQTQPDGVAAVHVIGSSLHGGDNPAAGREAAVQNGLTAAVFQAMAGLHTPQTISTNFQTLNEAILTHCDQFIDGYKVIAESRIGKTHRVLLQVDVSAERLTSAMSASAIRVVQPSQARLLVCVAEKINPNGEFAYWWSGRPAGTSVAEKTMAQILTDANFPLVAAAPAGDQTGLPPELSVAEAVTLGRAMGAEVVIVGTAVVEEVAQTENGTPPSMKAAIAVQALRTDDGRSLAQSRRGADSAALPAEQGSQEALRIVAAAAAQDLVQQLIHSRSPAETTQKDVALILEGTSGNMAGFVKFRGMLTDMAGVTALQVTEMTADSARMVVTYQGAARALAEAVRSLNFEMFTVDVVDIGEDSLRLHLNAR